MAKKPTNGIDADIATDFVARIEDRHAELESMKGSYMRDCKGVRGEIKDIYSEAKDAGIPVKALKTGVKHREYQRKQDALKADLDIDTLSAFEQLQEALGGIVDLPLGKAAIDAAKRRDGQEFDKAAG